MGYLIMAVILDSYIYFYHTDNYIILPAIPESVTDSLQANFSTTSLLSRSAPIYTYSNSGPRTVQVSITLHRDMMQDSNYGKSNFNIELGDDYVDTLIKQVQAVALPRYDSETRLVDPPIVALRLGSEIFVKGVVTGGLTVNYSGPIRRDRKYALVTIGFTINEIDPIDATMIQELGSWRAIPRTLERRIYSK